MSEKKKSVEQEIEELKRRIEILEKGPTGYPIPYPYPVNPYPNGWWGIYPPTLPYYPYYTTCGGGTQI